MGQSFDIVMVWYQNDWGLYGRRNEMLARALARHPRVRKVVHIEPPVDLEQLKRKLRTNTFDDNVTVNLKRIQKHSDGGVVTFTPHIPGGLAESENRAIIQKQLHELKKAETLENIILWLYPPHVFSAMVIQAFGEQARLVVSDCVDDHRTYARTQAERDDVQERYASLLNYSDIVFCVSSDFTQDLAPLNQNIHHIPNAAGTVNISENAVPAEVPTDLKDLTHPVVGYTGALSFRIDCGLLAAVARAKPDWNIVLIGTAPSPQLIELIDKFSNLHWLGPKKYTDLAAYLDYFDVAIIPHRVDAATAGMNPLKLYEYLRYGKPVVSTGVAGVEPFRNVIEIADTHADYVAAIEKCLTDNNSVKIDTRKAAVQGHAWEDRVNTMMEMIATNISRKQTATTATPDYYQYARPEVQALVPISAEKILDIGCANGALGQALKQRQPCEVTGIEYVPKIAQQADAVLDKVLTGSIEGRLPELPVDYYDCIILADVLEHLRDPESLLVALKRCLAPGGSIVASIPNVRHWSVLKDLLGGRWEYADAGILDHTHLRFFTKSSLVRMFTRAGFSINDLSGTKIQGWEVPDQIVTSLGSAGLETDSLKEEGAIYQYLLTAIPQKPIKTVPDSAGLTSIIVLAYNQLDYTQKCIESIVAHTREPFELILVDNASTDGTAAYMDSELPKLLPPGKLKVIHNETNLGFAEGNNQGMAAARGDCVLLLNNDVVVTPGWLGRLRACADRHADIGIVGPVTNFIAGSQRIETVAYDTETLNGLHTYADHRAADYRDQFKKIVRVVGFCMLIKRDVLEKIGGLDTRYGLGNFEDDDFSLRAVLAGYGSCIAQDCFVHHFGNRTFAGLNIDYEESLSNNWEIFKAKWELPVELPYGSGFDVPELMKEGFIPEKHFCPLIKSNSAETDQIDKPTQEPSTRPVEEQYREVQQLVETGQTSAAIGKLEDLLRLYPDFSLGHNDLAVLYYGRGEKDKARDHYRQAAELEPDNLTFLKNLADFNYVELGRVEEALQLYNRVLAIEPQDLETLLIIGHICVALQNFEDAKNFYNRALAVEPWNEEIGQFIAAVDTQSREAVGLAAAASPQNLYREAQTHVEQGDAEQARTQLESLVAAYPAYALAYNDLGVLYYQAGEKEKSLEAYQQAVDLEPGNLTFKKNLADFKCIELQQVEEALKLYNEILASQPDDLETLITMGQICVMLGQKEDARHFYNQALTVEPWNAEIRQLLEEIEPGPETSGETGSAEEMHAAATSLAEDGKLDEALSRLRELVAAYPDLAVAHNDLGVMAYQAGEKETAQSHYEKAVELEPDNAVFQKNLADFYCVEQGRVEEAMHIYVDLLAQTPEDVELLATLGQVCEQLEKTEDAQRFYEMALNVEPWNSEIRQRLEDIQK